LVEKKTGFDGSRTLIQGGFCAWCNAGSIFAQDMEQIYNAKTVTKVKSQNGTLTSSTRPHCAHHLAHLIGQFWFAHGRHSHYPRRHDLDFVFPVPKLKPD
jgi:hypothetical protein